MSPDIALASKNYAAEPRLWPATRLLWPCSHRRLDHSTQLGARCAARRLHGHAMNDRDDVAGEVGGVRAGGQIAFRYRPLETPA
jgi:hypothetical protein